MKRTDRIDYILLEVSNIALNEGSENEAKEEKQNVTIDVQLKGDWEDDRWLIFGGTVEKFKALMEAMKEKRPIHAKLVAQHTAATRGRPAKDELKVTELRVSFSASTTRT
jgi:hypothetical protein